jgi:hypothetical protein
MAAELGVALDWDGPSHWAEYVLNRHGKSPKQYAYDDGRTPVVIKLAPLPRRIGPQTHIIGFGQLHVWTVADGESCLIPGMLLRLAGGDFIMTLDTLQAIPVDRRQELITMPKATVRDAHNYNGPGAGAALERRPAAERCAQLLDVARKANPSETILNTIMGQAEQLRRQIVDERTRLDQAEGMLAMVGQAIIRHTKNGSSNGR